HYLSPTPHARSHAAALSVLAVSGHHVLCLCLSLSLSRPQNRSLSPSTHSSIWLRSHTHTHAHVRNAASHRLRLRLGLPPAGSEQAGHLHLSVVELRRGLQDALVLPDRPAGGGAGEAQE